MLEPPTKETVYGSPLWPTPTARDWKGSGVDAKLRDSLDFAAERGRTRSTFYGPPAPKGLRLNPDWVEWLMGWPVGWTRLDGLDSPDTHPWSSEPVPRVAPRGSQHKARLKMLGNGQVPQCGVAAWSALEKVLNQTEVS